MEGNGSVGGMIYQNFRRNEKTTTHMKGCQGSTSKRGICTGCNEMWS